MQDGINETARTELTRREAIGRAAVVGGTLLWAAPAIQTIGMTPAFAQTASPPPDELGPSYIAINLDCGRGRASTAYAIKYEGCTGSDCFESEVGATPSCEDLFDPQGAETDGDTLGIVVEGPDPQTGCVTMTIPSSCRVRNSVIKKARVCCEGPTGTGILVFCPC